MIALGVATTWIAISIVGAKGLIVFARAAASGELEVDPCPLSPQSGLSDKSARLSEAQAHKARAQVRATGEAQPHAPSEAQLHAAGAQL
jgi:hypothetical protein